MRNSVLSYRAYWAHAAIEVNLLGAVIKVFQMIMLTSGTSDVAHRRRASQSQGRMSPWDMIIRDGQRACKQVRHRGGARKTVTYEQWLETAMRAETFPAL